MSALGVGAGKPKEVVGEKTCSWSASGKFGIRIGFIKKGLGNLTGAQGVQVGKHQAVQLIDSEYGGCAVILEISSSSSAVVVAAPNTGDPSAVCPQAVSTAKIIDPKLP